MLHFRSPVKKRCGRCGKRKSLDAFSKNRTKKDGLNYSCRECHAVHTRKHYLNNKAFYKAKAKQYDKDLTTWIRSFKDVPCKDCKQKFKPWQMDFDHVRGKKLFELSDARLTCWSRPKLLKEMAKCEVVCSNCHRDRTYQRLHATNG